MKKKKERMQKISRIPYLSAFGRMTPCNILPSFTPIHRPYRLHRSIVSNAQCRDVARDLIGLHL